jgi:hypothetical protein
MSDLLQGLYDPELHSKLDALNETMRDVAQYLKRVNTVPTTRVFLADSQGYTNDALTSLDLHGRAIKGVYFENGSGQAIAVYPGSTASGIPLAVISPGTYRIMTAPELSFDISFTIPASGLGIVYCVLSEAVWTPGQGAII